MNFILLTRRAVESFLFTLHTLYGNYKIARHCIADAANFSTALERSLTVPVSVGHSFPDTENKGKRGTLAPTYGSSTRRVAFLRVCPPSDSKETKGKKERVDILLDVVGTPVRD